MDGLPDCAQIWPHQHAGDHAILFGHGACEDLPLGERHFYRFHAFKRCPRGDLRSVTLKRSCSSEASSQTLSKRLPATSSASRPRTVTNHLLLAISSRCATSLPAE